MATAECEIRCVGETEKVHMLRVGAAYGVRLTLWVVTSEMV